MKKKSSSKKDRILDSEIFGFYRGPNGDVPYTPAHLLPSYARASCHKHEEPIYVKDIADLQAHNKKHHKL